MSTIIVTGATGFIGRHVVSDLAKAGHSVLALSRSRHADSQMSGVTWKQVSYDSSKEMAAALKGADILVHLAENADRGHVDGSQSSTQKVLDACVKAKVRKIVLASSIYARLRQQGQESAYGDAKLEIENLFKNTPKVQTAILRLPPVYGQGCKGGFAFLTKLVGKGIPMPFGSAKALRDYISVSNVSNLIRHICELDAKAWASLAANAYEPSDDQAISTLDLIKHIGGALGKKPTVLPFPKPALRLVAKLAGKADAIDAAFAPLRVENKPELVKALNWKPIEAVPESLSFLTN